MTVQSSHHTKTDHYFNTPLPAVLAMLISRYALILAAGSFLASIVSAGPIGYGLRQASSSGVVMACYFAAGFTWGATLGTTAPASIILCNSSCGACQTACAAVFLEPIC
jgi:hypothetical protein